MSYSLFVLVLSGAVASGKTTLAKNLSELESAEHLSTSRLISAASGRELSRSELQQLGMAPGYRDGTWLVDAVSRLADRLPASSVLVVDAVRTLGQVQQLREAGSGRWCILHVHLTGEDRRLAARHHARSGEGARTWDEVMRAPAEAAASLLEPEADVLIDTGYRAGRRSGPGCCSYRPGPNAPRGVRGCPGRRAVGQRGERQPSVPYRSGVRLAGPGRRAERRP